MHTKQIGENLFLIDLQTGGSKNLIASYILKGKQTAIVETGPTSSIPNLLLALKEANVEPEDVAYVAISHIHIDHGGGVGTLLKSLPNAKVVVHPRGVPHLVDPEKLWEHSKVVLGEAAELFGKPDPVPVDRITVAAEGLTIDMGKNVKLQVYETIGHAAHHLSFYEPLNRGVFPGDTAGAYFSEFDAIVPTTPPPFRLDLVLLSLEKLISLKPEFLYYSHFGKAPNSIKRLRAYELQLELWAKITEEGVRNRKSPEHIEEKILAEDENMRRMASFFAAHPIDKKTLIDNSVQGFIDFVEKQETKNS